MSEKISEYLNNTATHQDIDLSGIPEDPMRIECNCMACFGHMEIVIPTKDHIPRSASLCKDCLETLGELTKKRLKT